MKKTKQSKWLEQREQDRKGIARVIAEHRYDVVVRRSEHLGQQSYPVDPVLVAAFTSRITACGKALELLGEPNMEYVQAVNWRFIGGGE